MDVVREVQGTLNFRSCAQAPDRLLQGLSGRTLRRLPVLAHARALAHGSLSITRQSPPGMNGKIVNGAPRAARRGVSVERWVADMGAVVAERRAQLDLLG